jgi:hypothetical protein
MGTARVTLNGSPVRGRPIERHHHTEIRNMSAWVCNHEHIAALVGSFLGMKDRYTEVEDPRALAKMLHFENMRSVDHRYRDNPEAVADFTAYYACHPVTLRQIERWEKEPLTPGQFFKALDCYEYQACECDDWKQSEAYKLCEKMRGQVCARVAGYESTPWGIDYPPPVRIRAA